MRIMWIVNTIFPFPSKKMNMEETVFGGWMLSLMETLVNNYNIELAVVSTYNGKYMREFFDGKVKYYVLPTSKKITYDVRLKKYFKNVVESFNPDVVHIHGSEFPHGLVFLDSCPHIKTVVSIQGFVSVCGNLYLQDISNMDVIKNITLRDIIKRDTLFQQKKKFSKRGISEYSILKRCNFIIGRTKWDYEQTKLITDIDKYRSCNESLRNSFYNKKWDYKNVEKNTIFVSQASYPIKGFHAFIKALPIVKKEYPNIVVYVSGGNILDISNFKKRLKLCGYGKYLLKLIKKYDLKDNIKFIGMLSEKDTLKRMMSSNLFVQPSIIENSSNSLGEAMLIGMPIVASDVGGTSDLLINNKEGMLYSYGDTTTLAEKIIKIFKDSKFATKLGENAQKHAIVTHNRDYNSRRMMEIYNEIIKH